MESAVRPPHVERALQTLSVVAIEHDHPGVCADLVVAARYVVQLERELDSRPRPSWWSRFKAWWRS